MSVCVSRDSLPGHVKVVDIKRYQEVGQFIHTMGMGETTVTTVSISKEADRSAHENSHHIIRDINTICSRQGEEIGNALITAHLINSTIT